MVEVALPRTDMREIRSQAGHDYRIFVTKPAGNCGPSGFPVLYLLDGNATFATAAASLALQTRRPGATRVGPAVIVGIGYPTDDYLDPVRRTYDYTLAIPAGSLPPRPDGSAWPPTGGASAFLDFVEDELKPRIESEFTINKTQQAIFGHSFGGLFVLHALFTRPGTFRTYIAASPSVWFGNRAILDEMEAFIRRPTKDAEPRNLLVTVGSLEQSAGAVDAATSGDTPQSGWVQRNRMIDNARAMTRRLSNDAQAALHVEFKEFEDENHSSVLPAAISRALRFALAPAG